MPYNVIEANVREKVLLPLKNEIIKIPVTVESDRKDQENQLQDDIPDFKLVFRKEQVMYSEGGRSSEAQRIGNSSNSHNPGLEFYTFRDFLT